MTAPAVIPPLPADRPSKTPVFRLISELFLEPGKLYERLREPRWRALLLLFVATVVSGVLLGVAAYRQLQPSLAELRAWFIQETVSLRLDAAGNLSWGRPPEAPDHALHGGWRLDFAPASRAFAAPRQAADGVHGLWLAPRQVVFWQRDAAAPEPFVFPIVTDGKLYGRFPLAELLPGGGAWDAAALGREWDRALPGLALSLIFGQWLGVISFCLFYLAMFAVIPVLLRTKLGLCGFTRVFSLYCHAALPPLAVATIYSCLNLPWLQFSYLFLGSFMAYTVWAGYAAGRRALRLNPPSRRAP